MESLRQELERIVSPQWVSSKLPDRIAYSRDQWPRSLVQLRQQQMQQLPALVVWPEDAAQAAAVLALCHQQGVQICATGGGSSVTGASAPQQDGVVIDLKRLDRIRWLHHEDGLAEVEGGIIGMHLEEELQRAGHTLGHFPSSIMCSTLGGWAATRSAGQASSRYGKIEDLLIDVEIALPDGSLHWCRHHYDITPILVGSEGTMGLITACRIRLYPAPQARQFRGILFPTLETGLNAMRQLLQETTPAPTILRLYDPLDSFISSHRKAKKSTEAVESLAHPHIPPPGTMTQALVPYQPKPGKTSGSLKQLFQRVRKQLLARALQHTDRGLSLLERLLPSQSLLILGYEEQTEAEASRLMQTALAVCAQNNGKDLGEGPGLHWFHGRYNTSFKQSQVFLLGAFSDTMEVACSWTQLQPLYRAVRSAIQRDALVMAHFSHAYPDGCSIYFSFAGHAEPSQEVRRYDRIWRHGLTAAARAGATISHHHGVGINKAPAMQDELGDAGLALLRTIQEVMGDPNLLNPGKLLPADVTSEMPPAIPVPTAPPQPPALDKDSMLLQVDARHTLETVESFAQMHGMTAGFRPGWDMTLRQWVEHSEPWVVAASCTSPYDLLYGLSVTLPSGQLLRLGHAPRTSAGPDLRSLFWQTHGCFGTIQYVTLRLHRHIPHAQIWKIPVQVQDGLSFLRDLVHHQQCPRDAMLLCSPHDDTQHLFIEFDPQQTPRIQQWLTTYETSQQLLASPVYPQPSHPWWLGIQARWSDLSEIIAWLREQAHPLETLSLANPSHTTGTLFCSFALADSQSENGQDLRSIASDLRAAFPDTSMLRIWGETGELAASVSSSRPSDLASAVLQKLKQTLDPTQSLAPFPTIQPGSKEV